MPTNKPKTVIIAIGEPALRDAGTGQFLLELVRQIELPDHIDIVDCGTSTDCIVEKIDKYQRFIILTAYTHGAAGGEIIFTTLKNNVDEVLQGFPPPLRKIIPQLINTFRTTRSKKNVEWILLGVEPKSISTGGEISDDVIKAAPKVLTLLYELIWESKDAQTIHYFR